MSHKDDIRNLIFSSDLFLTTPSTTILEGILYRTPTIILDYYYTPSDILYNDDQIILTAKNKEEIKKSINKLLFNIEFRKNYVNDTYKYGLRFCKGFDQMNYRLELFSKLYEIIESTLNKKLS